VNRLLVSLTKVSPNLQGCGACQVQGSGKDQGSGYRERSGLAGLTRTWGMGAEAEERGDS